MEQTNEYLSKMVGQMMDTTGIPMCFVCGKRIVGMHIDYMDKNRVPRKVCIGCVFTALDFYLNEREKRIHLEVMSEEK